jgi:hypothetical protein
MPSPLESLLNLSEVAVESYSQVEGFICIHLGVMEGIHNKIKLIMRLGYGLTNFENIRSRLKRLLLRKSLDRLMKTLPHYLEEPALTFRYRSESRQKPRSFRGCY